MLNFLSKIAFDNDNVTSTRYFGQSDPLLYGRVAFSWNEFDFGRILQIRVFDEHRGRTVHLDGLEFLPEKYTCHQMH